MSGYPWAMAHRVTLIPGDGIGPEVAAAARLVLDATGVTIEWDVQEAGAAVMDREGTPLPDRVLESIRRSRTALKGPVMKLGQLLSMQSGTLPEEALLELANLQMQAPGMHASLARVQFKVALGKRTLVRALVDAARMEL